MCNNWDFDAAGFAFEKLTKQDIYQALKNDLAEPLGMQDYVVAKQKKIPTESVHPEFAMYLSTRELDHAVSRYQSARYAKLRRAGAMEL
jgi:CubicO group peptidase (beta-lactamase class C family)